MSPLHATMLGVLRTAGKERPKRQEWVKDPMNARLDVPAWVLFEREAMLNAINVERAKRGATPIDVARLYREECQAHGHSDYDRKYALYSAWLVEAP